MGIHQIPKLYTTATQNKYIKMKYEKIHDNVCKFMLRVQVNNKATNATNSLL